MGPTCVGYLLAWVGYGVAAYGVFRAIIAIDPAVVATIIFAEKVTPSGARLSPGLAEVFVLFGVWVAVAPASVPGLTEPDHQSPGMMRMEEMPP